MKVGLYYRTISARMLGQDIKNDVLHIIVFVSGV